MQLVQMRVILRFQFGLLSVGCGCLAVASRPAVHVQRCEVSWSATRAKEANKITHDMAERGDELAGMWRWSTGARPTRLADRPSQAVVAARFS